MRGRRSTGWLSERIGNLALLAAIVHQCPMPVSQSGVGKLVFDAARCYTLLCRAPIERNLAWNIRAGCTSIHHPTRMVC
ncbi:hypothetical protein N656DRAFT_330227 [Canariomyces notabilis]|uniref:Uncharacterized protein n=1 Tax=Canariomyces notabilis TaxID=2074819 RepID=A0AAN6QG38_9PEZI|nr:hypothetical protein N656DRAFT_330227 [Canariomyces arenarius]